MKEFSPGNAAGSLGTGDSLRAGALSGAGSRWTASGRSPSGSAAFHTSCGA